MFCWIKFSLYLLSHFTKWSVKIIRRYVYTGIKKNNCRTGYHFWHWADVHTPLGQNPVTNFNKLKIPFCSNQLAENRRNQTLWEHLKKSAVEQCYWNISDGIWDPHSPLLCAFSTYSMYGSLPLKLSLLMTHKNDSSVVQIFAAASKYAAKW